MIKYIVNEVPPLGANCYTVYDDDTKNCLIIDLGGDFYKIIEQTKSLGLTVKGALLTHAHFDHAMGTVYCKSAGIPVFVSKEDSLLLLGDGNLAKAFGLGEFSLQADGILAEGKTQIGGIDLQVIKTAGHTAGSVCFLIEDKLFSGDTLFCSSYGRYDLPTGNFSDLKNSIINKLFTLNGNIMVLPGHGGKTTIERERKYNPINDN
ncbi:MAG: MBL fold metallo-hydrolase [Clostridia bacterium]|nr:MBL fold metallo-hydrolase [Clostridia bacterium]